VPNSSITDVEAGNAMTRRGLVLGCGGTVGGAWQVGALAAVAERFDWDPRTADVIVGTSSGSTLATMLGAGVGVDEMVAAQHGDLVARESVRTFFTDPPAMLPKAPIGLPASPRLALTGLARGRQLVALSGLAPTGRTDPSFLDDLVDDLVPSGEWVDHPRTWIVAASLTTGSRTAFGSPRAPKAAMRDAVRASWAVPGWYPAVTINGSDYLDGGMVSPASADLVRNEPLDEVVIIAPMASNDGSKVKGIAGRAEALLRKPMSRTLEHEVTQLKANGIKVTRVHPGAADLALMGPNFMDPRRRIAALECALAHVPYRLDVELSGGMPR
jgi:NTE family protein